MTRMFRLLNADEIECRVSTCTENGVSLLLYKDARCDQNILDETVGPMNWERSHSRDNANCTVSIWDKDKGQWISKEDTGTESYTEKEKGLASDSFKRACFNWGIGRELYTAPFIWITADKVKLVPKPKGAGMTTYDKFDVQTIGYDEDGRINQLTIINPRTNVQVYTFGKAPKKKAAPKVDAPQTDTQAMEDHYDDVRKKPIGEARAKALEKHLGQNGILVDTIYKLYKVGAMKDLTENQHQNIIENISKIKEVQDGSQSKSA